MEELSVQDLRKSFGKVRALAGVSFALRSGELLTLLGPSGCGKTTCLRLIAGFDRPDAGEISVDGKSILHLPPERRRIGFVFQNYALFPHMSVARNIAYGIRFRPGIDTKARVKELLGLIHLEGLADRRPGELSGGERQRVALARALAPFPQLLLLDEPLSALDAKLREELRGELRRIQRELSIPTVYVTHDQEEALAISDRVGVMRAGRIEQIGEPRAVYTHPKTLFSAEFIGRTNRFSGTIAAVSAERIEVEVEKERFQVIAGTTSFSPGMRVILVVREEELKLTDGRSNSVRGRIEDLEYHGEATTVLVSTPIGPVRVRVAGNAFTTRIGESVEVYFPPERLFLFPAEAPLG